MPKTVAVSEEEASVIALQALAYLAGAPDRLGGFLALTGLEPQDLHERAGSRDVQSAVLSHLMGNESELLVFSSEMRIPPEMIGQALQRLSGAT